MHTSVQILAVMSAYAAFVLGLGAVRTRDLETKACATSPGGHRA